MWLRCKFSSLLAFWQHLFVNTLTNTCIHFRKQFLHVFATLVMYMRGLTVPPRSDAIYSALWLPWPKTRSIDAASEIAIWEIAVGHSQITIKDERRRSKWLESTVTTGLLSISAPSGRCQWGAFCFAYLSFIVPFVLHAIDGLAKHLDVFPNCDASM